MKLLLVTYEYPPDRGGVANYLGGLFGALPEDRRKILRLKPMKGFGAWLRHLPKLCWTVARYRPDVLVVSHVLPLGTAAHLLGVPYVVVVHGLDLRAAASHPRRRQVAARVLRGAKLVVANSRATASELAAFGMDASSALVLTPCPSEQIRARTIKYGEGERERLRAKFGFEGKKVLLSAGRLVPRKGFDRLIRLLPALREACGDVMLVIAGEGAEARHLREDALRTGLDAHVRFMIAPDADSLASAYRAADLFALAVRASKDDVEGFGIVFLEAALFGLASVSSRVGGVPEAVLDGETGLLVDPDSEGELFEALKKLLNDPESAARLGAAARDRAVRDFVWETRAKKLVERLS